MKKKLLFVIYNLGGGGAERVLLNLIEGLEGRQIEPVCLFYDLQHVYRLPETVRSYDLGLRGLKHRKKRIAKMREILKFESPDVVFSFMRGVNVEAVLAHWPFRGSMRLILSEHNRSSVFTTGETGARKRRLVTRLYPKSDRIVAVSREVKKDLVEHFRIPAERIEVIHNPVNIERVNQLSRETVHEHPWFNERIPLVVNVGAFKERKGQAFLLRAFKRVHEEMPCRLVFIGKGDREAELRELAGELGLSRDVAFLPFQENPFKFVARASVFVLPSVCEGCPNVVLEAMACETPVISTRWLGADEIIDHGTTGLLVPLEDEQALAMSMMEALSDKSRMREIAGKAREALTQFSMEKITREYMRLFELER